MISPNTLILVLPTYGCCNRSSIAIPGVVQPSMVPVMIPAEENPNLVSGLILERAAELLTTKVSFGLLLLLVAVSMLIWIVL
jgi:hypothetical protein